MINHFKKTRIVYLGMLSIIVANTDAVDMLDRGSLIFEDDFSEALDPEEWVVSQGAWSIENGALKGVELEADDHPAFLHKEAPLRNVVIQLDFRFDGCSEITFSTNHDGGHNSRVVFTPTGFTMRKDVDRANPADSGEVLGHCDYSFEAGKWYTVQVEYYGDEMLARVDEDAFILGSHPYIDQPRVSIRFPMYGDFASFDNVKAWEGILRDDWPEKRGVLLESQKARTCGDPTLAWQIALCSSRAESLKSDPEFRALVAKSDSLSRELQRSYPVASVRSKAGRLKNDLLMKRDATYRKLREDLSLSRKAESRYLHDTHPRLAELSKRMRKDA